MKQRISPFAFDDHREFLRTALKEKGFSYRGFAAKHSEIISFISLALALSKGRSGTKNKPSRNFSLEMLARLGKALRLGEDEITYLLLLKLENDSEVFPGIYGSAYKDCIRRLTREYKSKQSPTLTIGAAHKGRYSQTANTVAELLDALPSGPKDRLAREILAESRATLARQKKKAGVKPVAAIIERLEELTALGSP